MKYMMIIIISLLAFNQNIDPYLKPHQEIYVKPENFLSTEHDLVEMYSYGDGRLLEMTWQNNSLLIASTKGLFSYSDSYDTLIDNRNKIWSPTKAVFNPNHQMVITNEISQGIQLWNVNDGTLLDTIDYVEQTDFFAVDNNNLIMLTGSGGGQIELYNLETSLPIQSTQAGLIYGLELHPSGKYYAYFGASAVTIYDIEQHSVVNYQVGASITDMMFDSVKESLIVTDYLNNIHIIEAETGVGKIYSPENFVIDNLNITQNGTIVAVSIEQNETLLIYDSLENAKRLPFSGTHVALNSDETKIALAQLDGTIQMVDIASATTESEFGNFIYRIDNIAFHPQQTQIGMAIWNKFGQYANKTDFIVWNFENEEIYRIQEDGAPISAITYFSDTDVWVLGLTNGQISLYSENLEKIVTFSAYEDYRVYKMLFNQATQTLITLSSAGELKLWDVSNLEDIEISYQFEYRISDIAINHSNNSLLYTSGTSIVLWNLANEEQNSVFPEDSQQATYNPDAPESLDFWKRGMYALFVDDNYLYSITSDIAMNIPSRIQTWDLEQLTLVSSFDIEEIQLENFIVDKDILIANALVRTNNGIFIMNLATMTQIPYTSINFASVLAYNTDLLAIAGGGEIILFSVEF